MLNSWYNKYNTSNEGRKIKAVTLINEPKHILDNSTSWNQKQAFIGVHIKRCSANMQQIYRRPPMPKCDFDKVTLYNFIEIILRHKCSPVNSQHIFRAPFPKNTSGWRLLYIDFILTLTLISNRIWCSHIFTPKLSSLNNLCEIYRYSNREKLCFYSFWYKNLLK